MSHTPGPWTDGHNVSHEPTVRSLNPGADNGGFVIATCYGPNARDHARLIAAAPDLLEALNEAIPLMQAARRTPLLDKSLAAIAKATGAA